MEPALPGRANPFPGLRPFRTDEDYLFFGREAQAAELVARLGRCRFLGVVGTSGSGKSSLVRSGLLPELLGGTLVAAGSSWEVAVMRPGGAPVRNLSRALIGADLYDPGEDGIADQVEATLKRSGLGLVEAVRQSEIEPGANLLVVVDQFEEIFRFHQSGAAGQEEAADFVTLLLEAGAHPAVPVYVVLTMRSDFIGDCARFPGLAEAVNDGEYLIPRMDRAGLQRAIEGPVKVAGGEIAPRLVQRLLNDLGDDPDQLPILQHALMRTWDHWAAAGGSEGSLDLPHYRAVGGMAEALSRHADEVVEELPDEAARRLTAQLFQALTVKGEDNRGIRRPKRMAELCAICEAEAGEVAAVVEAFRRSGRTFLMPPETVPLEPGTVVDISHESLMRIWHRLGRWVDEEAQSARIYVRLAESAALWRAGEAGLYRDPDLQIAQSWRERDRPNADWARQYGGDFEGACAFLEESAREREAVEVAREAARQRELEQARELAETQARAAARFKRFTAALVVLSLFGVTALVLALVAERKAEESAQQAQDNAAAARRNAEEARRNAEEAGRLAAVAEAEKQRARQVSSQADFLLSGQLLARDKASDAVVYLARSLRSDPGNHKAAIRLVSTLTYNRFVRPVNPPVKVLESFPRGEPKFDVSPDGSTAVVGGESEVRVLGMADGRELYPPVQLGGALRLLAASRDGRYFFTAAQGAEGGRGGLRWWHLADGTPAGEFDPGTELRSAILSGDRKRLIGHGADDVLRVYDLPGGGLVDESPARKTLHEIASDDAGTTVIARSRLEPMAVWRVGGGGWIELERPPMQPGDSHLEMGPLLSPDGSLAAAAIRFNRAWAFHVWDVSDGSLRHRIASPVANDELVQYAFGPGGRKAAVSFLSGVRVWDMESGEPVTRRLGHEGFVVALEVSPDGSRLATGSLDGSVGVWSVDDGRPLTQPLEHRGIPGVVRFSSGGTHLSTVATDGGWRLWDLSGTGALPRTLAPAGGGQFLALSDDWGRIARLLDGRVQVYEVAGGTPVGAPLEHLETVLAADLGKDGSHLLTVAPDALARWVDLRSGQVVERKLSTAGKDAEAPRNDGRFSVRALDASNGLVVTLPSDLRGVLHLWDLSGPDLGVRELSFEGAPVGAVSLSADGGTLVATGRRLVGSFWNLRERGGPRQIDFRTGVMTHQLNADGSVLITGSMDGNAQLWDTATGTPLGTTFRTGEFVIGVALSPDGTKAATLSFNLARQSSGSIQAWDVASREALTPRIPVDDPGFAGRFMQSSGHRSLVAVDDAGTRLFFTEGSLAWDILPAGVEEVPGWFCDLAEAVVGKRLGEEGGIGPLPAGDFARAARAATDRVASGEGGKLARWGAWMLADPGRRPIAPGSEAGLQDHLADLADDFTEESLRSALSISSVYTPALARLGLILELKGEPAEAERWTALAERIDPGAAGRARSAYLAKLKIAPREPGLPDRLVDLSPVYNASLDDDWQLGSEGYNLRQLPRGRQVLGGVEFDLRGVVQLSGTYLKRDERPFPERVERIPVGRTGRVLHFLHSCSWTARPGEVVGAYTVYYADGGSEEIPVHYARDVLNWNLRPRPDWAQRDVPVVWRGSVPGSARPDRNLFLKSWTNPHPEVEITHLGFSSAMTDAAPFLIALTVEDDAAYARRKLAEGTAEALEAALEADPDLAEARARIDYLKVSTEKGRTRLETRLPWSGEGRSVFVEGGRAISAVTFGGAWKSEGSALVAAPGSGELHVGQFLAGDSYQLDLELSLPDPVACHFAFSAGGAELEWRGLRDALVFRGAGSSVQDLGRTGELVGEDGAVHLSLIRLENRIFAASGERPLGEIALPSAPPPEAFVRALSGPVAVRALVGVPVTADVRRALEGEAVLVPRGAAWRFLDDGSIRGAAWRAPEYDDTRWVEGPGQLGYGDGDEATRVGFGGDPNDKFITTYFRRAFEAADPSLYNGLSLSLVVDDGAVIYLNGAEIARYNLAPGPVGPTTLASATVQSADEGSPVLLEARADALRPGRNVVAVEVHQVSGTSSDLSFDLQVEGRRVLRDGAPAPAPAP